MSTSTGTQAAANPWQYAGGYKDTETGYTKFGARYYDPTTGRFTQPDPSGQEANAYLYAGVGRMPTPYFWFSEWSLSAKYTLLPIFILFITQWFK